MTAQTPSRRAVLSAAGALLVGFSITGRAAARSLTAPWPAEVDGNLDAWIAVGEDGRVTLFTGKVDLGTGTETALAQVAAEELDIRMDQIRVVQGDTALTPDQGPTWGSVTIVRSSVEVRAAAATARARLLALAADALAEPVEALHVREGIVQGASGHSVAYGALLRGHRFGAEVDRQAPLKPRADYRLVGTSVPRVDIPDKVTGRFEFVQDVKVPGMLHGRTVIPPRLGATLEALDEGAARAVTGVVQVVRQGSFAGVVARTEWAAIKGAEALAPRWTGGVPMLTTATVFERLRATPPVATVQLAAAGDAEAALATAARRVTATFEMPFQTHGSIGPSCAVAEVRADGVTVWSATQAPHWLKGTLADLLGLADAQVRVIYVEGAGCYGRNGHEDAAGDAVLLSRAAGAPVRVQWTRAQEHGSAPMGPAHAVRISAGLDAAGRLAAWSCEGWLTEVPPTMPPVALPGFRSAGATQVGSTFAGFTHGNQQPGYIVPNQRVVAHRLGEVPVRVSWIRSPGRILNVFAVEGVIDELAEAAGADPVAFRLAHAPDARARAVIERVATLAGWPARGGPRAAPDRTGAVLRGRGIAYCRYSNTSTYVAMVADVAVERSSGAVRLERMFVSHDCGQMVNPDGVLNQVQGQVIQTASRALYEEVGFDGSAVTTLDWASYPIMRFGDAPRIVVDLVPSDQPPMGAAEPASAPVIAAIANAVFDATGIRFRRIPSMRRGSRPHWQRHEWDQDMSMTTTRRGAAALAAILTAAGPAAALAAAPQAGQQLPGARRFRLGRFEVTALLDGHLDLTLDLFPGAAGADAPALLRQGFHPPAGPIRTPVNAFLINTGDRLTSWMPVLTQVTCRALRGFLGRLRQPGTPRRRWTRC
jgi:CO/xanthine dehydrogenase Mo-binding subunit